MKKTRLIKNFKIRMVCALMVAVFLMVAFGGFVLMLRHQSMRGMRDISEEWTVEFDGNTYENVDLREFMLPRAANRGDTVYLTKKLESYIPSYSSIRLLTYLSIVEVSFDDQRVYSYGWDEENAGKMVGSGYHFFRVQKYHRNKDIRITITATEDRAFTSIDPIYMMPSELVMPSHAENHAWSIFISIFLFMLGLVVLVTSLVPIANWQDRAKLAMIGAFSLLVGMWDMSFIKLLELFSTNYAFNSRFEYVSLYLAPVPLLILITGMRRFKKDWRYYARVLCTVAMVAFNVFAIVAHATNVIHICRLLSVYHVLTAIGLVVGIITGIQSPKRLSRQERMINIGLVFLFAFGMMDLIRFNVQKYFFPYVSWLNESALPVGVVIFILCLLIGYLLHLYDIMTREVEKDTLTRLAYRDSMTGLYNRASMIDIFEKTVPVDDGMQLLLFDMNGLKHANDALGHAKGDELITCFAEAMETAFGALGICARIGGDEFAVLISGEHAKAVNASMDEFQKLLDKISDKMGFKVAAAYGIASCREVEIKTLDEVYRLADARMYGKKQRMKAEGIEDFRE